MSVNDGLLLIGHGSRRYPDAAAGLQRHADRLRVDGGFSEVSVGLLNGTPDVADVAGQMRAATVRVVPYFMEAGYFTRIAIPRALGAVAGANGRFHLCPPIGTHDAMGGLIERQGMAACTTAGITPRTTALLVIGHGSASAPGRTLALHEHTARVAWTEMFARVEAACLEEAPFVAEALRGLRNHPVMVIGFFANQGGHVRDDIPALIEAERADRGPDGVDVRFIGCVTDDPAMTDIIKDQAAARL